MAKWILGGICCIVLAGFVYFKMLEPPLQPWSQIGRGLTEMLSPVALIVLAVMLYPTIKKKI